MAAAGTATGTAASGSGTLLSPSGSSNHCLSGAIDERQWVDHIRNTLADLREEDKDVRVSVFKVTNSLLQTKPEAYAPQLIALGPYHQWRPELNEMERYKLSSAKSIQKTLPSGKIQDMVDEFRKHNHDVRAHYHRYLDFAANTLAWMMVVDACFLLEFLEVYAVDEEGRAFCRVTSLMRRLVNIAGRCRSAQNIILRDVMMMENQIPLFLLKKIKKMQVSRLDSSLDGDELLLNAVTGFIKELSPLKKLNNLLSIDILNHAHLLEVLYYFLVGDLVPEIHVDVDETDGYEDDDKSTRIDGEEEKKEDSDSSYVKQLFRSLWEVGSGLNIAPVQFLMKVITSRPVTFVVKVPWKLLRIIPGFSILMKPVESFFSCTTDPEDAGKGGDNSPVTNKPPKIEEIAVPSVEELVHAGVRFSPTDGNLQSISFNSVTATFYLPVITLDVNTDVVLRNLVAYEAAVAAGPLVMARYTELMNGIIDTDEDVKLLRQSKVVINTLKSDASVAHIWNGMSKSIRLTKVPFMDKAIEGVNRYHSSRWRVKTRKYMKKYVFGSWQVLTFLAAILLLLLTALQSFCSVYSCVRWFNVPVVQPQG